MKRQVCLHGWSLAVMGLLAGAFQARAAWRNQVETVTGSGVTVEASSPFDNAPPTGTLPVWVTIHNGSGTARTWTVVSDGDAGYGGGASQHTVTESLRVENNQTSRLAVLVPLDASTSGYNYHQHFLQVDGYGVNERQTILPASNNQLKGNPTPAIGMGEDLATPAWAGLTKWYADAGQDLMGSPVDMELLGNDWRALAGLDVLWLSDASYGRLDAGRRTAVRDWVSRGGLLCLCAQSDDPALRAAVGLPPEGEAGEVGLGSVRLVRWDGKPLPSETVADSANQPRTTRADPATATAEDWPMTHAVGKVPVDAAFLIGFILAFAVLVGPVNLFVFARSARRHRLFWTTPLISVAASLLLMAFILLKDGFGGSGQRALLCVLLPDQRRTVIIQEQVARTGVVLSHQFQTSEDLLLASLHVADGPTRSYEQEGRNYTGEWFTSRSVQAQRVDVIEPSRAEIILANPEAAHAGAAPVLTSSVPVTILTVRYLDPSGNLWVGDGLRTGDRLTLHKGYAKPEVFALGSSAHLNAEVLRLLQQRGSFVAVAGDGPFLETLPSIRWTTQRAVFAGPVTGAR